MKVKHIDKERINAYLMAMYFFQFGFLQPIASFANSQVPIAGFSLILVLVMLINNGFKVKKYVIITFLLTSAFLLVNSLVYLSNSGSILKIYGEFVLKGFSAFLIASVPVKTDELYTAFLRMSIVNFVAIFMFPFVGFLDSMNYMRFGYAMIPSALMFLCASYDSKFRNPTWIILAIVSLSLSIVFGSRGPIIVVALFIILLFLSSHGISLLRRVKWLFVSTIGIFVIIKYQLIAKLIDYIQFSSGVRSYSLSKIRMMMDSGLAASSSGRNSIYERILMLINENPVIGHGVGVTQSTINFTAHNIFLQILIESGFIGMIIWIVVWVFLARKYLEVRNAAQLKTHSIVTLIVAVSIGRLLVSSDMWLRPEYWFAMSMLLGFKHPGKIGVKT